MTRTFAHTAKTITLTSRAVTWKFTVLALIMLTMTGCYTAAYKTDSFNAPPSPLDSALKAYVAIPEDGRYGDELYPGSGNDTASAIIAAISVHGRAVMAKAYQSHDASLASAKETGSAYLFEPAILHWEDRATEWSGLPDRITIRIDVYDCATDKGLLADAILEAHSSWWTLGGDHPQDLLPKTVGPLVDQLYGTPRAD
jgi:Domain of unknown function (DUF4823)